MSGRLEGIRRGEWTLSLRFSPIFDADEGDFFGQTEDKNAKPRKNKPINLTILSEDEEKLPPLVAGAIYTGEDWETLLSLHAKADALRRALECLSRGDLSRRALYTRLRQKGIGDAESRFAVGRVVALGDLREEDQLRRLCLSLSGKGKGPRVILAKAATAGYRRADAERVLRALEEEGEIDFSATARVSASAWADNGLSRAEILHKLYAAGFDIPGEE